MMCADILQRSCHIEHQWRSGGRWMAAAKYDILQKVHLTSIRLNHGKADGAAGKDEGGRARAFVGL